MKGKMSADFLDRRTGCAGFTGVGGKAFDLPRTPLLFWDEMLNSILLILSILSKNPFTLHETPLRG
jgi:hypothetical protein